VNLKPPPLRPGNEIAIIAPAGPVTQSELQPSLDLLRSTGYKVTISPNVFQKKDYLAGDDDARLEDLHSVFQDENVKAVFCARGGYGTPRLLDKIDYELIRRNPKILVGYSDITALLFAIYSETGLVTFHGPMVKDLSGNSGKNLDSLLGLVSSREPLKLDLSGGMALNRGRGRGILLGGNLSLISNLTGTPFMPPLKGVILFIEERGEPLYRIDRMLTHLRLGGLLDDLAGLMAGRFEDCGDISDIDRLLMDITSDLDIPVFSGLPVGHGMENVTLPLGVRANLDADGMTLSVLDTCVMT